MTDRDELLAQLAMVTKALTKFIEDENWQRNEGKRLNFPTDAYRNAEVALSAVKKEDATQLYEAEKELVAARHALSPIGVEEGALPGLITALRAQRDEALVKLNNLIAVCVNLENAIHSEPTMSGHLTNLHISPVRGEPALREFKLILSTMEP